MSARWRSVWSAHVFVGGARAIGARRGPAAHALHVAPGTESAAGAREDQAAHAGVLGQPGDQAPQGGAHDVSERVADLGPVERDDGDAVVQARQELVGTRVQGRHRGVQLGARVPSGASVGVAGLRGA